MSNNWSLYLDIRMRHEKLRRCSPLLDSRETRASEADNLYIKLSERMFFLDMYISFEKINCIKSSKY